MPRRTAGASPKEAQLFKVLALISRGSFGFWTLNFRLVSFHHYQPPREAATRGEVVSRRIRKEFHIHEQHPWNTTQASTARPPLEWSRQSDTIMETLHRLAGVQEASDLNNSPTDPSTRIAAVPIPPLPGSEPDVHGSRASLPLNRKASYKSFKRGRSGRSTKSQRSASAAEHNPEPISSTRGGPIIHPSSPHIDGPHPNAVRPSHDSQPSAAADDDEFAWGPAHPCFPHPNPHCAVDSAEAQSTRVIRVKRDWLAAGDLYPQYANLYPEILAPLVSDEEFRFVVSTLNAQLKRVFDPNTPRARVDSLLGALTGYLWEDVGLTGAHAGMRTVERFLEEWNAERVKQSRPVRVVMVRTTGFMSLDFVVPLSSLPLMDGDDDDDGDGADEEDREEL
nr:ras modification protein erf4 [Quercus suber]